MRQCIVISAVNITIGGTLTILKDCLDYLSNSNLSEKYDVYAIVHLKKGIEYNNINYIELPKAKRSWLNRLYYEYFYFRKISNKMNVILWLSLHDVTPNVIAKRQAVYCHNAFPFYKSNIKDVFFNYKTFLFSCLTFYIYKINQKRNYKILIQQHWMYSLFKRVYHICDETLMLTPPLLTYSIPVKSISNETNNIYTFLFPSTPNSYKNFECLCEAAKILEKEIGQNCFQVLITIKGDENKYAKWLLKKYSMVSSIKFIGYLSNKAMSCNYNIANCLVFPSKNESWGLPISEFAHYNKPMLLANLPYSYEASQNASKVSFFNPDVSDDLMQRMKKLIFGDNSFLIKGKSIDSAIPLYSSWKTIFIELLKNI